jgi:NosR/NirI family transcriptional regulator, nitrous oxide reductase regulator
MNQGPTRLAEAAPQNRGALVRISDFGFLSGFGFRISDFLTVLFLTLLASVTAAADLKFPPPEFESGYAMPKTQNPIPRALWLEYGDVLVLAAALGVASWAVHKKRSRKWVIGTAIFSLLYFGFYREGCVCAIGSIQNVALGLSNSGYAVPIGVIAFFGLPLIFALFFGRTFCAAVCPHGALQDLILLKPIKIPGWIEQGLGVIPFIYLGLAALFAATGSAFIICEFDPFIPLFRLSGSTTALSISAAFLVAGLFIGRPYCRFLCPYGALLRIASVFSKWRVRITPDTCTQCTLCAESCPYGVIREPGNRRLDQHGAPQGHLERARSSISDRTRGGRRLPICGGGRARSSGRAPGGDAHRTAKRQVQAGQFKRPNRTDPG